MLLIVSKNFPLSAASSKPVTKSPTDAKTSNRLVANPPRPLAPTKFPIGPRTDISPFFIKSNPEKNPLAIRLILLRVSSVGFIFSIRVLKPLEIFINCWAVTGGNTSRKALLTAPATETILLKAVAIPSIMAFRPPRLAQSCSKAFRASADLLIISDRTTETFVHISRASSKSPIMICQDLVQPEPRASFKVSINCEKVFTLVAAF